MTRAHGPTTLIEDHGLALISVGEPMEFDAEGTLIERPMTKPDAGAAAMTGYIILALALVGATVAAVGTALTFGSFLLWLFGGMS